MIQRSSVPEELKVKKLTFLPVIVREQVPDGLLKESMSVRNRSSSDLLRAGISSLVCDTEGSSLAISESEVV